MEKLNYSQRLHKVIPGGCHTYSKGDSCFPENAPQMLIRGKGCYVYDAAGNEYLDYGMGLRSVAIGYGEPVIIEAAMNAASLGNNLTRPSMLELEAAEFACGLLELDMVKFTKNGSTATTAAIKLAKIATGKEIIACANQPFFSYDDWFISTTSRDAGTFNTNTKVFKTESELNKLIKTGEVAAVILEPKDFDLALIRKLCDQHGVILIFDEMITGFRYHWPSVSIKIGVKPDLATFGKAMANGFSVALLGGKREIMELGARPDVFLASTTHGAEMSSLAAFIATAKFMEERDVSRHLRYYRAAFNELMPRHIEKTLFMQEILKNDILMPYESFSWRHGDKELMITKRAIAMSMEAIEHGARIEGKPVMPVFA